MNERDLPGGNRLEVAGESKYAAALQGLVDDGPRTRWASLVPEFENPWDPNAIAVRIDGIHVGYLNRANAISFHPVAERILELGCDARCTATITGGRGIFGVLLELGSPEECLTYLSSFSKEG